MAFFVWNLFLCSFCCLSANISLADNGTEKPSAPDLTLAKLILDQPDGNNWKVRLVYGHGAPVSRKTELILQNWTKGKYGEPYFLNNTATLSDQTLYRIVQSDAKHASIPAMRIQAFMLWHGRGVKRNTPYAVKLWMQAAKAGDETAAGLLAQLTNSGNERKFARQFESLKKERLKLNYGKGLYVPQLFISPQKHVTMISLRKNESVNAFLNRAVRIWKNGGQVCILMIQDGMDADCQLIRQQSTRTP